MATQSDIAEVISRINDRWAIPKARNGHFGNVLKSLTINNVRGVTEKIEFTWPVTAIAGTNGSGKTTLLQLCSAAYVKETGGRVYKIGDWVRNALGDETPAFDEKSSVSFTFWDDSPQVEIPYQKARTRWGYPRTNPKRNVAFIGIGLFAPRIERRDRLHVYRAQVKVKASSSLPKEVVQAISSILNAGYTAGSIHTVGPASDQWSENLPQLVKNGKRYGEHHMGAGEQKIVALIRQLEAIPARSLILLEEPEITLHPDAQRGLAWYLMSLSHRKGHQIIVSTHSGELFETLPLDGRLLMIRANDAVTAVPRAPYIAAARQLNGVVKSNQDLILVEDAVAQAFLRELLRQKNKQLLDNCAIVPVGNTDDVYRLVQSFRQMKVRAIGVRDPDIGASPSSGLFSLPGDLAPESLLLTDDNVAATEDYLNGITTCFSKARVAGIGHTGSSWAKKVFPSLAHQMDLSRDALADRLTISWLRSNSAAASALAGDIDAAFLAA